ncbi:hypothetical protein ACFV7Q_26570 [Streptomyces sp. NPDC059851]|uniref:hypothetical protein n=1 Tax=Streptomyces sp. NPDC059851 TaxID=3346971 RepID=UPI0036474791
MLGPGADCHARWAPYAPAPTTVPGARVLDARRPEVRRHVVDVCTRLVRDHGLDGLKLDFLDEAALYAGDGRGDVGRAMAALLAAVRTSLERVRPEGLLLELRQPCTGPGTAAFGNLLRSFDCPADAAAGRVRTLDTALLAVGGAVHSDMLLWSAQARVETVARQLIGALHAVPQPSVGLDRMPEAHRATVASGCTDGTATATCCSTPRWSPVAPASCTRWCAPLRGTAARSACTATWSSRSTRPPIAGWSWSTGPPGRC